MTDESNTREEMPQASSPETQSAAAEPSATAENEDREVAMYQSPALPPEECEDSEPPFLMHIRPGFWD